MKTKNWSRNRIIGSIAEMCVEQHFEQLGYKVEKTGIEHIAPFYAHLEADHEADWSDYATEIRENYRKLPDFLISRVHPSKGLIDEQIRDGELCGDAEALFVEAKFRTNADLDKLGDEFLSVYGENAIIYLVANGWHWESKKKNGEGVCVFVNLLEHNKWWKSGMHQLDKYMIYTGSKLGTNFNSINQKIIQPALNEIFKA